MVYSERFGMKFKDALIGSIIGMVLTVVLYLAARFEWVRKKLPAPGEGPTDEAVLGENFFVYSCWALPDASSAPGGTQGVAPVRVKSTFAVRLYLSLRAHAC